ncbi:hypothetical protein Patl1_37337 [Pistacia atlantica]|nr:hypothetical protein Patl1_37337 [Pistacia atlantica]
MEKPRKILHKARDFYVKSMEDCASKVGYGGVVGCPTAQLSRLPRSFSVNYSKSRNDVSKKMGNQMDLNAREEELRQQKMENYGAVKRCYTSVGLGKIGRIDEDRPCYFEEDMLYARSRSYAAKEQFQFF